MHNVVFSDNNIDRPYVRQSADRTQLYSRVKMQHRPVTTTGGGWGASHQTMAGVHGSIKTRWIWSEPGGQIAPISAGQWGDARQDEVATRVDGVFPLPLGMEREDRCERTGLET